MGNPKNPLGTVLMYRLAGNTSKNENMYEPKYEILKTAIYKNGLELSRKTLHNAAIDISKRCNIPYEKAIPSLLDVMQLYEEAAQRKKRVKEKPLIHTLPTVINSFNFSASLSAERLDAERAYFRQREYDIINLQFSTKKTMEKRLNEYENLYREQTAKENVPPFP
jgi:hypothetical protein